jgi:abortive infection bacteriophage resistance protein
VHADHSGTFCWEPKVRELKKPRSYSDQIENLKLNHGLVISDDKYAEFILRRVNYYRLSAYGIGLYKQDDKELFLEGITIEHLYSLYIFDCKLRSLLTMVIEALEIELRTKISYYLAMKYGSEPHKNPAVFKPLLTKKGESIYEILDKKFETEVFKGVNLPCVLHHQQKYGGHFPIWAAVELYSFGMLSSLYKLMQDVDKDTIASEYCTKRYYLEGWILSLLEIRNKCAHYGRIYNMPLQQQPYLYIENKIYYSNKLFPILLTMQRMNTDKALWTAFINGLTELIEAHPEVIPLFMGFPSNWMQLLRK